MNWIRFDVAVPQIGMLFVVCRGNGDYEDEFAVYRLRKDDSSADLDPESLRDWAKMLGFTQWMAIPEPLKGVKPDG